MEKNIKVEMHNNKDITIASRDRSLTIRHDNREIEAQDIYELLDYKKGDSYTVEKKNDHNLDENALDLFYDLIKDIVDKLNTDENVQ